MTTYDRNSSINDSYSATKLRNSSANDSYSSIKLRNSSIIIEILPIYGKRYKNCSIYKYIAKEITQMIVVLPK